MLWRISSPWNDDSLRIASDPASRARYRSLQSWYRETVLGVPPGLDRDGRAIASLLPEDEVRSCPGMNFITDEAAAYAKQRAGEVLAAGGTLEEDRLRRNMLSSMPLCFNILGSLRECPRFRNLLAAAFDLGIASVESVDCEWAPDRRLHLNDRTAFDAFITYREEEGRRCFLGIETKYTEPFSHKEYNSDVYQSVTTTTGLFRDGAGARLMGGATNQLWRMAMLAASLLHRKDFQGGGVAVLSLAEDDHARVAIDGVRAEMIRDDFVKHISLERLIEVAKQWNELEPWAQRFQQRYLDLTPLAGD